MDRDQLDAFLFEDTLASEKYTTGKKKFCARRSCDAVEKIGRGGETRESSYRANTIASAVLRRSVYRVRAPEKHVSFVYKKLVARTYSEIFDIITSNYLSIDERS